MTEQTINLSKADFSFEEHIVAISRLLAVLVAQKSDERELIIELAELGLTNKTIASVFGKSPDAVRMAVARHNKGKAKK